MTLIKIFWDWKIMFLRFDAKGHWRQRPKWQKTLSENVLQFTKHDRSFIHYIPGKSRIQLVGIKTFEKVIKYCCWYSWFCFSDFIR